MSRVVNAMNPITKFFRDRKIKALQEDARRLAEDWQKFSMMRDALSYRERAHCEQLLEIILNDWADAEAQLKELKAA